MIDQTTAAGQPEKGIATFRYVDHCGFSVPDLAQAITFFTDALGGELLWREGPFTESPTGIKITSVEVAMVRLPNINVELTSIEAPGQNRTMPVPINVGAGHMAFYVDDLEAAAASLSAHGATLLQGPINAGGEAKKGERIWYFKSPWGMYLELVHRPAHLPYEAQTTARLYGADPNL